MVYVKKVAKECSRCRWELTPKNYIEGSKHASVCRRCHTDDEILEHSTPQISKLMKSLQPKEKQSIIKGLLKTFIIKQYERKRRMKLEEQFNGR